MKNTRKLLVGVMAAASVAAASALVYAAPPAGPGSGGGGMGMMGGAGMGMMGDGMGMMGGAGMGMMGDGMGMMGGGMGMMGDGMGMMGAGPGAATGGPVAYFEDRLAALKSNLKITANQESAWDAYAKQVKAQAEAMEAMHTQAPVTAQTMPERLEQRAEFAKLRAEQVKALSVAVKDLYAVLTPEQKALADRSFGGTRLSQRSSGR